MDDREPDPKPGRQSPFAPATELHLVDADRALAALFEAIAKVGLGAGAAAAIRLRVLAGCAVEALGARRDSHGRALVGRLSAIDLAAEMLECADEVARAGFVLEAFALEGIEGRLIESLLGSGPALKEAPGSV